MRTTKLHGYKERLAQLKLPSG